MILVSPRRKRAKSKRTEAAAVGRRRNSRIVDVYRISLKMEKRASTEQMTTKKEKKPCFSLSLTRLCHYTSSEKSVVPGMYHIYPGEVAIRFSSITKTWYWYLSSPPLITHFWQKKLYSNAQAISKFKYHTFLDASKERIEYANIHRL